MFAYVPAEPAEGNGHAVVTDRFVCLLGEESPGGVAVELFRLLERPQTTIADVLDVFALHGETRRFAIVEVMDAVDRVVQVAVSGDIAVDLAGASSTRVSGPTGATSCPTGSARPRSPAPRRGNRETRGCARPRDPRAHRAHGYPRRRQG